MNNILSRKWMVSVVVAWAFLMLMDELMYTFWKRVNPGSMWTGILVKHPITAYPTETTGDVANGYRPAGGP